VSDLIHVRLVQHEDAPDSEDAANKRPRLRRVKFEVAAPADCEAPSPAVVIRGDDCNGARFEPRTTD